MHRGTALPAERDDGSWAAVAVYVHNACACWRDLTVQATVASCARAHAAVAHALYTMSQYLFKPLAM